MNSEEAEFEGNGAAEVSRAPCPKLQSQNGVILGLDRDKETTTMRLCRVEVDPPPSNSGYSRNMRRP